MSATSEEMSSRKSVCCVYKNGFSFCEMAHEANFEVTSIEYSPFEDRNIPSWIHHFDDLEHNHDDQIAHDANDCIHEKLPQEHDSVLHTLRNVMTPSSLNHEEIINEWIQSRFGDVCSILHAIDGDCASESDDSDDDDESSVCDSIIVTMKRMQRNLPLSQERVLRDKR